MTINNKPHIHYGCVVITFNYDVIDYLEMPKG